MVEESFISVAQAAERLGVTPQSIRNWANTGKLSARKTGRRFEIRERDIEDKHATLPPGHPSTDRDLLQNVARRVTIIETELQTVRAERDQFRADSAAARAAALEASAVSAELVKATRQIVDTLAIQVSATSQLLTPNSPAGL
jgi:excisionase family DNA binding protein